MMNLCSPGRHFLARSTVDDLDAFGAQAHRRSGRIHGHVSSTEYDDVFTNGDRRVDIGEFIGLHQIGSGQVLVGRENSDQIIAWNIHESRQTGTDPDVHGVKALFKKFIYRDGTPNHGVAFQLAPQTLEKVDLLGHDSFGQTELRDAVDQHAAGLVKGLIDGNVMAFDDAITGHGETRGSGADDGNFFAGRFRLRRQFPGAVFPLPVRTIAFQVADGHRFALFTKYTQALTLYFLGTDPAADCWQSIFAPQVADRRSDISFGDQVDKTGNIDTDRTALDTGRFLALQTSGRLFLSHLVGISRRYFKKISGPDLRVLLGHCYSGVRYRFCRFFRHVSLPVSAG